MTKKRIAILLACNILGILLLISLHFPWAGADSWFVLDRNVFYFFNNFLDKSDAFLYLVAFTNLRAFDAVAFLFMLAIFLYYYQKADAQGRHFLLAMGVVMLLTAIAARLVGNLIDFDRASPTKFFFTNGEHVNLVSKLTHLPAKDWSSTSFPGDHGMVLILFSLYMFRYLKKRAFLAAVAVIVLFSLPRIMSGAHWITDLLVGSMSLNLIVTSWFLLTPLSDKLIHFFLRKKHWA